MPERFTEWLPVDIAGSTVALQSLHHDRAGLVILLEAAERIVEVSFGRVVAFRSTLEESCLSFWAEFHQPTPRAGSLWIIAESEWLASFTEADLLHYPGAVHYMIVTDDERIDIIASTVPVARVVE